MKSGNHVLEWASDLPDWNDEVIHCPRSLRSLPLYRSRDPDSTTELQPPSTAFLPYHTPPSTSGYISFRIALLNYPPVSQDLSPPFSFPSICTSKKLKTRSTRRIYLNLLPVPHSRRTIHIALQLLDDLFFRIGNGQHDAAVHAGGLVSLDGRGEEGAL